MLSFDVFISVTQNKLLNKQLGCGWFETPWCSKDIIVTSYGWSFQDSKRLPDLKMETTKPLSTRLVLGDRAFLTPEGSYYVTSASTERGSVFAVFDIAEGKKLCTLKSASCHDANFIVTDAAWTRRCDNHLCRQRRQSWHHTKSQSSVLLLLGLLWEWECAYVHVCLRTCLESVPCLFTF